MFAVFTQCVVASGARLSQGHQKHFALVQQVRTVFPQSNTDLVYSGHPRTIAAPPKGLSEINAATTSIRVARWQPCDRHLELGRRLRMENGDHVCFAVSVKRGEPVVGHEGLLQSCWRFLRHGGRATCEVTGRGKRGNGLEVKYQVTEKLEVCFSPVWYRRNHPERLRQFMLSLIMPPLISGCPRLVATVMK